MRTPPPPFTPTDRDLPFPDTDDRDELTFISNAAVLSIPTASDPLPPPTVNRFDLADGHCIVCEFTFGEDNVRITWSGTNVTDGRVLWLAIWDLEDDARRRADLPRPNPLQPMKWFMLGSLSETPKTIDIDREDLPPVRAGSYGAKPVLSRQ
jgi:hypothetical protein